MQHPQYAPPSEKELHVFDYGTTEDGVHRGFFVKRYGSVFRRYSNLTEASGFITGDITPSYHQARVCHVFKSA
jgi:hypothetical protein